MRIIEQNLDQIRALCEQHKVSRLFAFGSVLTDSFRKTSDIDMLVGFSGIALYDYADNYFGLKESLEHLLNHPVDLLEEKALNNPYLRQSIESSKKLIYGSGN